MINNAIISSRLEPLLNVMDARANVEIFIKRENGSELLRGNKLYNLLADDEFIGKYRDYSVFGLTVMLGVTTILIGGGEQ